MRGWSKRRMSPPAPVKVAARTRVVARLASGPVKARKNWRAALADALLALGIGVGEETADGQQQNGAQAQAEPGGDHEAGGFADQDGGDQHQEEAQAATHAAAVGGAERQADQGQDGKEGVDAQLDAHPAAQRNCPATHGSIVAGRGEIC